MKNLENFGVQELNSKEIRKTDGGFLLPLALALTAMGIHDAIDYPEAFMRGLRGE